MVKRQHISYYPDEQEAEDFEAIADTPGLYDLAMQTVLLTAMPYGSIDEVRFTVNGRLFEPPEDIY